MRLIFSTITILLFINCSNNKIKNEIESVKSRKLVITYTDMDTVRIGNSGFCDEKTLRIISYVDSLNCTSCKIGHIYLWEDLIDKMHSYNGNLSVEFIFSNANNIREEEWQKIIQYIPNASIFIDRSDSFVKHNPQIPQNPMLHTFLVDNMNNVLLIGDPIKNKKVENLFWSIIKEKFNSK